MAAKIKEYAPTFADHRETEALRTLLNAALADLTVLRTQFVALLVKMDDDAGITDADYESTLTPAALTLQA